MIKIRMRRNKGITLIALVITIIILLILAGISISALTQTGIFEKANQAKNKSEKEQKEENNTLGDYENTVNEYLMGANRENEDIKFKNCSIEIVEPGIIKVKNVENIFAFTIVNNGKSFDITKGDSYNININMSVNETANIYVIAVDENANFYKSNIISYTKKGTYLYNYGNDNSEITGGWKGVVQNSSNCKFNVLTDGLYMNTTSRTYSLSAITTNNSIDLTKYNYLCCEIINSSDLSSGYCAKFGISSGNTSYQPTLIKELSTTTGSDKKIYKLDISDITGNYYPTLTGVMEAYVYRMWME